jgi:hypothetical protein
VDGAAADRLAAVLAAHGDRVGAVHHPLIGPVKLVLLALVGGEILQRPKIRPGVESHD